MSATTMMLAAFGSALLGRWSHNQPTPGAKQIVQAVFALVVIAALDQGRTADIAKGFAGLFLVAVLLGKNSPLDALKNLK